MCSGPADEQYSLLFAALPVTILLAARFDVPPAMAQGSDATAKILALENKWDLAYQQRHVVAMSLDHGR